MHALKIQNLQKIYASGEHAVKGIDLCVEQGDFFALLGPNGAGKSTTIGIVSSLVNKTSGSVHIYDYDLDKDPIAAKSCLGLVPQEINFNQFETVLEIVLNQAGYYGIPRKIALTRAEKYLNLLALWEKKDTVSRNLSGGMKRRLMIARSLIHQPKMLILDEPSAGVDIELRRSTWDFLQTINKAGTTIILTTHYLEEAEYLCNGIAIIDKGEILESTTIKKLLSNMQAETFVLDLDKKIDKPIVFNKSQIQQIDDTSIEVTIPKTTNLNELFAILSSENIGVTSMRNKANRLEELFIKLINGHDDY